MLFDREITFGNVVCKTVAIRPQSVNSSPPHPKCRIYASVNRINIGSDNGLSPIRRQAIIWTNDGLLLIALPGTDFSKVWKGILLFENVVCEMASILSQASMG